MVRVKIAEHPYELEGILQLQSKNMPENLQPEAMVKDGFLTLKHSMKLLSKMQAIEPQIIAVVDDKVVGYALTLSVKLRDDFPILYPMFEQLNSLTYNGRPIAHSRYYIMGQVCVDKKWRGKGVFAQLYAKHIEVFKHSYDYCITEVSDRNKRSMKAHYNVGFQPLFSFLDDTDAWHLILLELNKGSVAPDIGETSV